MTDERLPHPPRQPGGVWASPPPADPPGAGRWNAVDALFEAALERPPKEREEFLAQSCAGAPDVQAEVEELLEAAAAADPWIACAESLVQRAAYGALTGETDDADEIRGPGRAVRPSRDPMRGRRIGPWRIIERLGRGGMGDVYRVERADGQFEQVAALKLLRRGLDTDDILDRFAAERQILATLTHPNIARLLDGGATEDGRPYLVLEYVEGDPITEYCDAESLGIEERLRLFVTACRAVQHAHQNLVLHRDLKPSNILVTSEGQVKLVDFGIAKLLDEAGSGPMLRTRTGMRMMTPEYASPEQVRGETVTTASDVYQLGMLLYELLARARPYELRHRSLLEMERVVCEEEPPAPSRRVRELPGAPDAARLRRRLRGDLDAVVLRTLRKEPEVRYGSVAPLLDDVDRYLKGLPVRAGGDGLLYRARKFVWRRRWPLSTAAALILLAVSYLAMAAAQSGRLARERDRARVEAAKAEEVREFLVGLFDAADPAVTGGNTVTARALVDEGARRVRRELTAQPEVRAEMLSALADVYRRLAVPDRALSLAREALDIRASLFPEGSPEVAASLRQVSLLAGRYGMAETTWIDPATRDALLRRAAEATRKAHGARHPYFAQALHELAMYGEHSVERRTALEDSAIAILRAAPASARPLLARVLAEAAHGSTPDRALTLSSDALSLRRELYGEQHREVAESLSDLALIVEPTDPDSSERLLRRALDIHRAAAGSRHPVTVSIQSNLAGVLRDQGDYARAVPLFREALEIRRAEGQDPAGLAYTKYGLAASLVGMDRHREAAPLLREVMQVFPPEDYRHSQTRLVLAGALTEEGRLDEAEEILRAALAAIHEGGDGPAEAIRQALGELRSPGGPGREAQ